MIRKLQYQAISQAFPPQQQAVVFTPPPFTQFSIPVKAGLTAAVIATTTIGFIAPPRPVYAGPFTQFSQPTAPRVNLPDEQTSTLFEVSPPSIVVPIFSKFSDPVSRKSAIHGFTNAPQPAFVQPYVFTAFSQPLFNRIVIPDEQPNPLFEVEPPQPPPFTGFATFSQPLPRPNILFEFSSFQIEPIFIPVVDTHDGVWVKRKRKPVEDLIALEIEEKAKRRAALELAIYGPGVTYEPQPLPFEAPKSPPDVAELSKLIAKLQASEHQTRIAQSEQDDEDDLEAILREIL